jgi:hypothetical protein
VFGAGSDPLQFVWFLAWFPWAISQHASLFYTHLMWQPLGVPLLWVSSVPLPCLALMPATLLLGPVVVYNLMILAAPVLSAFCAYVLCRRFTGALGALLGGYVFGFSAYEMAADLATPNLSLTFLLPCLVLLAVRRMAREVGRVGAVLGAGGMLVAQFFISIEVFATMVFFAALAWGLAVWMLPAARARLMVLLADGALAGLVSGVVLAPFLVEMFRHFHYVNIPALWPFYFVADPVNFMVPTRTELLSWRAPAFPGILQEQDAYIGLPVLIVLVAFARRRVSGFLVAVWVVFAVASWGPRLWFGGRFIGIFLPWAVCLHLPLISSALPVRFSLFVSLASAVMVAMWFADVPTPPGSKSFLRSFFTKKRPLACLIFLALLPAPHLWMKLPVSTFFAPGEVERVLGPRPRLLVLPFGPHGPSTYWQAENRFGFDEAGGYLGFPPRAMQPYHAVGAMFGSTAAPEMADLAVFLRGTGAQYVVAGPGTSPGFLAAMGGLGWVERRVDDVVIFTVPAGG